MFILFFSPTICNAQILLHSLGLPPQYNQLHITLSDQKAGTQETQKQSVTMKQEAKNTEEACNRSEQYLTAQL